MTEKKRGSRLKKSEKRKPKNIHEMKITVRTLRMGWSAVIDVPDKCLIGELRQEAAKAADMNVARAKLVLRGAALQVRVVEVDGQTGWLCVTTFPLNLGS